MFNSLILLLYAQTIRSIKNYLYGLTTKRKNILYNNKKLTTNKVKNKIVCFL